MDTSTCNEAVAEANNSACASTLQNLQEQGICATGCEALAACCPALPGDNSCFAVAAIRSDAECIDELESLVIDSSGGGFLDGDGGTIGCEIGRTIATGTGGADCSALAACCITLTGGNISMCNEVAAEGDEGSCANYLSIAQEGHACGGP
jgi:hypothetical protein